MKLNFIVLLIATLTIYSFCKYEVKPSYSFQTNSKVNETITRPYKSYLSPDGKQLMVTSRDTNTKKFQQ